MSIQRGLVTVIMVLPYKGILDVHITDSTDMNLSKPWEIVEDR